MSIYMYIRLTARREGHEITKSDRDEAPTALHRAKHNSALELSLHRNGPTWRGCVCGGGGGSPWKNKQLTFE
jgi:hypothetical protein